MLLLNVPGVQTEADVELEKVLERKQVLDKMEAELHKREELLQRKEQALKEKSHIEGRKVRASQVLSGQVLELANQVSALDANIQVVTARHESHTHTHTRWRFNLNLRVVILRNKSGTSKVGAISKAQKAQRLFLKKN